VRHINLNEDYYTSFRDELLAKSKRLLSLTKNSKVEGDYHEVIMREFIRKQISAKYKVGHGLVYDEKNGRVSRECDVIVYEEKHAPLFESQDLAIVNPDKVKFVMEVKSTLNSTKLNEAILSLSSVKKLKHMIMCSILGFKTKSQLDTLYFNAWKSKVVQFLFVLKYDNEKDKNREKKIEEILKDQTKWFVENLRHYGESGLFSYSPHLIVRWDENPQNLIKFEHDEKENEVRKSLSALFR
jgi:hypothetical protein